MSTTETQTLTVRLPTPDSRLTPNARIHYFALHSAKKKAKGIANLLCRMSIDAQFDGRAPLWDRARVDIDLFVADRRGLKRDRDNLLASCKAYQDGATHAGVVKNDNGCEPGAVTIQVDRDDPRLMMRFTRIN